MTGRGAEPGPALVLMQGTDSEELPGKGGSSHIPHLLKHSPVLDTSPETPPLC